MCLRMPFTIAVKHTLLNKMYQQVQQQRIQHTGRRLHRKALTEPMVLTGLQALRVPQVQLVLQERQVHRVHKEIQALRVLRVELAQQVRLDQQAPLELQVRQVPQAQLALLPTMLGLAIP